jgi:hypothetical protein
VRLERARRNPDRAAVCARGAALPLARWTASLPRFTSGTSRGYYRAAATSFRADTLEGSIR